MFTGVITALVTPFRGDAVDEEALRRLVDEQIAAGIDGLVPVGTTGESPTVTVEEHIRVIEIVVQAAKKRVPVVAGTGSNSTRETIELSAAARKVGADGLLLVTPYYNRPGQEHLYRHFKAVVDAVPLPACFTTSRRGPPATCCPTRRAARRAAPGRRHQGSDRLDHCAPRRSWRGSAIGSRCCPATTP